MQITASSLDMSSSHLALQKHEVDERLRMWTGTRPDFEGHGHAQPRGEARGFDKVSLSDAALSKSNVPWPVDGSEQAVDGDPKLTLLRAILASVFGITVDVLDTSALQDPAAAGDAAVTDAAAATTNGDGAAARPAGYGVEYDYHEVTVEQEQVRFSAQGTVQTADGRQIQFELSLQVSRSFVSQTDLSVRLGDAVRRQDPLVVNFAGTAAQLSDQTFKLDLNGDGTAETAHFAAAGSGFLVFDRNGNGKIDQAAELFGPQTGDGFAELAALDSDKNGWIDEGDAAYAQLQVWTRDAAGHDQLQSLQQAGVGAISVARLATPFDIKDSGNALLGAIRSSGVWLSEDGQAGTVQQVDLAV